VFDEETGQWKVRRLLLEEALLGLNESQLAGEKIAKTLDFEQDAIKPGKIKAPMKMSKAMKSMKGLLVI